MRLGTEADIPWIVDKCRITHGYANLGTFCPDAVADKASRTRNLIEGDSVLCGAEIDLLTTSEPAVNHVMMWHTDGAAWRLLDAHEAASDLPASVSIMFGHPRSAALFRALSAKGYQPVEMMMVKS